MPWKALTSPPLQGDLAKGVPAKLVTKVRELPSCSPKQPDRRRRRPKRRLAIEEQLVQKRPTSAAVT